jgi:hypothetical protein
MPGQGGPAFLSRDRSPLVPEEGVEPTRPCDQRILSPPRLPFRHSGPVFSQSIRFTGTPQDGRLRPPASGIQERRYETPTQPRRLVLTYWRRALKKRWNVGEKSAACPFRPPDGTDQLELARREAV